RRDRPDGMNRIAGKHRIAENAGIAEEMSRREAGGIRHGEGREQRMRIFEVDALIAHRRHGRRGLGSDELRPQAVGHEQDDIARLLRTRAQRRKDEDRRQQRGLRFHVDHPCTIPLAIDSLCDIIVTHRNRRRCRENTMAQARFALYFTPAAGSALARFGAGILGYDCDTGALIARRSLDGIDAQTAAAATAEPARYGFHGTLMAPFALAPGRSADELENALDAFARARAPVRLGPLKVAGIGAFTALVPAGAEDAVRIFAGPCVTACN